MKTIPRSRGHRFNWVPDLTLRIETVTGMRLNEQGELLLFDGKRREVTLKTPGWF
jgi:hypothetical protein